MKFETIFRRFTFNRMNVLPTNLPFDIVYKTSTKQSINIQT